MDIRKVIEKLSRYKYISFDIFDTLVDRYAANPHDIFRYVEVKAKQEGIAYSDFATKRIEAEQCAIKANRTSDEISLDDIYEYLPNATDTVKSELKRLEVYTEIFFCNPNMEMINVLKQLSNDGKTIIITSDMYLPKQVIKKILQKCSVNFDYLFVSSEYGIRKSSGKLFKYIINTLKINKSQFIHIGDNWKSDWIIPKIMGFNSIHYKKQEMKNIKTDLLQRTIERLALLNTRDEDIYYSVGYKYLGPLLVGFCQWINDECNNKDLNKILFFSRDGYIMQKAYKILFPLKDSEYVYISRRSVTVPMLSDAGNWKDVIDTINYVKREETWKTLLHKMGLDGIKGLSDGLSKKYGMTVSRNDLLQSNEISVAFNEVRPYMVKNSLIEKEEAHKYLDPYFLDKKVAIVDIGWYGTMQHTLENFYANDNVDLNGYYIGLLEKQGFTTCKNAHGYVYDFREETPYNEKLIYGFNGLIESFFSANHGSCKRYHDGQPELEPWESQNWPIIAKVHEGALEFCKDIKPILEEYGLTLSREDAFNGLQRFMTKPTKKEIKAFGKIIFFDTYYEPIIRIKHNGGGYLLHPKDFIKDFLASNWKIGFLKTFVKLPIADKLYLLMLKLK